MEHTVIKPDNSSLPVRVAAAATRVIGNAFREAGCWLRVSLGMNAAIAVCSLTLIGIVWCAVIVQLQFERQDAIAAETTQNSNLVKAFEEHTVRTIKGVDAVTLFLRYEYARVGAKLDIAKYIEDGVVDNKLFTVVSILDERGNVVASSRALEPESLADREYFKVHIAQDSGKLFIGKPVAGRLSGTWSFQMTRRINKADGRFGGVVSVGVDPAYFTNFYRRSDLGENGVALLVGVDGISRARQAGKVTTFGQDMSSGNLLKLQRKTPTGSFLSSGKFEGVPRYTSYRTLPDYPLLVAVGTSQVEVLAAFSQRKRQYYLFALLFSAVIVLFAVLLMSVLIRQRRIVATLANNESRFRAIFNQAAIGIGETSLDGRFLQANRKLCEMLGYPEQELVKLTFQQITHPEDLAKSVERRHLPTADRPIPATMEKRIVRKDGVPVWVAVASTLVCDTRGEPDYFVSMIEDISDRKLAEDRFRATFEQAAVGIAHTAIDRSYLMVNQKFCDMLGYTRDELLKMRSGEIAHPDERGLDPNNARAMAGEIETYAGEKRYIRKDGSVLWVNRTVSVARDSTGKALYFIRVVEDISTRKEIEERLRSHYKLVQLQAALAAAANEAVTPEEAFQSSLKLISEHGGWRVGHLAIFAPGMVKQYSAATSLWQVEDRARFAEFLTAGERYDYASGKQLVGRAIVEKIPVWIEDLAVIGAGSRKSLAVAAGLHCAFAFPVVVQNEVAAVLEFYAEDVRPADPLLMENVVNVTAQLARVIERARANEAQARLAAIVESSQDAIVSSAPDRTILTWNAGAEKMFGYMSKEAIGQKLDLLVPDDLRQEMQQLRQRNVSIGRFDPHESERLTKDNRRLAVSVNYSPIKDGTDKIIGVASIYRDITERKLAEEAVKRERALLRAVVDAIPERIYVKDREGRFLLQNATNLKVRGITNHDDVVDKTVFDIFPRALAERMQAEDEAVMASGTPLLNREGKTIFGTSSVVDDQTHWHLTSKIPLKDDVGNVYGLVGVNRDVTERKQAEDRLRENEQLMRAAFDNAAVGIVHAGLDGSYLRVNAKFCALLGYTREELQTMKTSDVNHPDERDQFGIANRLLLSGEVEEYCSEKRFVRKDKSVMWAKRTVSLVKDAAGAPLYYIRIVEDITDRKQAEGALRQLNDELEDKVTARTADLQRARHEAEDASQAKSSFLAAMSHEIRTPMNGVVGMIDVLHQSSLKGDQVEMVDLIRESAFSLLGIIEDILDFSKIEAGKLELERDPMVLGDVVEGVCGMLNGMAEKKDVVLTLFIDPEIPALVQGDALRLRQVLVNLTNNAIKFSSGQSHAGRVSVRVLLVEQSAEKATLEFRVSDNGIGMDDETQARLFTAFTQADASTTRHFGGTGLGLVIANHLVELMDGEITLQSTLGEGATFKVRLSFVPLPAKPNAIHTTSEVAGLSCVVVGAAGGLADDFAVYLEHANALVERAPDLASARAQTAGCSGLSVWIIDACDELQFSEQLCAAARAQLDPEVNLVVVAIERGKRRRPRAVAPGLITVDGNALNRRTFLKAVAVAAGRASLEVEEAKLSSGKLVAIVPSRAEALQRGRLILIAEDNETNQKVIVRQLALLGYTADVAGDGYEALERWKSGEYALLLTDLHMPKLDGYELTQAIRAAEEKSDRRIPIIALTANALKGEAEHCRAVGMDDYRSKPSPLAELKDVLEKWLPVTESAVAASALCGLPVPVAPQAATVVPVNVKVLEALVGDDPDLVQEFLQDFRSSAARISAELRAACAANQTTAVAAGAHKLKSSARAVGAFALGELCAVMEAEAKSGDREALIVLLLRFETEMAVVEDYLDRLVLVNAPSEVI